MVGNGKKIRFWEDSWLSPGVILMDCLLQPLHESLAGKYVCDFVGQDGKCDWTLFENLLPNWVKADIWATIPAHENLGEDRFI